MLSNSVVQETVNRSVGSVVTYRCLAGFQPLDTVSAVQYRCNESKVCTPINGGVLTAESQSDCEREFEVQICCLLSFCIHASERNSGVSLVLPNTHPCTVWVDERKVKRPGQIPLLAP